MDITETNNYIRGRYYPHIDGLRAFAILPVLLCHAFPSLFPGGFIGVDVFFVISGYLITKGLLTDLESGKYKTFALIRTRKQEEIAYSSQKEGGSLKWLIQQMEKPLRDAILAH